MIHLFNKLASMLKPPVNHLKVKSNFNRATLSQPNCSNERKTRVTLIGLKPVRLKTKFKFKFQSLNDLLKTALKTNRLSKMMMFRARLKAIVLQIKMQNVITIKNQKLPNKTRVMLHLTSKH